jgi:hypothetical protein
LNARLTRRRERLGKRKMLDMIAEPCDFALQFAGMDRVSAPGESATLGRVSTPEWTARFSPGSDSETDL